MFFLISELFFPFSQFHSLFEIHKEKIWNFLVEKNKSEYVLS